jgi:serine/threonine-protein kinase
MEGGSGTTRPFRRGTIARTAQEQQESRLASIITALILVATLFLLGFSIYLAGELGFIPLPWTKSSPPTAQLQQVAVPDLKGKDYQAAKAQAEKLGFKLLVTGNLTTGQVKDQSPEAGQPAVVGTTISVTLQAPQPLAKVPTGLVHDSLEHAELQLNRAGIKYSIQQDPNTPTDPAQAYNVVSRTDPAEGATVNPGQQVTIYVVNYYPNGPPTHVVPTPTTAPTLVPTPTSAITPTPTTPVTPTKTPKATPTAKPGH